MTAIIFIVVLKLYSDSIIVLIFLRKLVALKQMYPGQSSGIH
jgi:hypothetical protein